jgi:hypothetical protein
MAVMVMDCMIVRFTSTYHSCHGHDCMRVGFTSTYGRCHVCMIIRFTSTYGGCRGHDYNDSLIVIFNLLFFFKSCDALIFVVRLRFLSLNNEKTYCIVWSFVLVCLSFAVLSIEIFVWYLFIIIIILTIIYKFVT